MINFLNLEYFLVVAEELNFTKAAKKLFISQQSLSCHISKLESDLDVQLFNRTTPLTLTPSGKSFVKNATTMLKIKEQSVRELSDIKDFKRGDLYIGVSHTTNI
jgi:DNA-binding transcriptional LysR family regulator